jgi:hypothetical protein
LICIILSGTLFLFAQKAQPKKAEYTNYYMDLPPIITDGVIISFEEIVSKTDFIKLKINFKNTTADYFVFKPQESVIKLPQGDFQCIDKQILIPPFESNFKVLDIKSDGKCLVDSFSLLFMGLYKFTPSQLMMYVPNFILSTTNIAFNIGSFQCNMQNLNKQSQETAIKFECNYFGDKVGVIDPNKAMAALDNGQLFPNGKPNMKQIVLFKGDNEKFTLYYYIPSTVADMQTANMQIDWKNTFTESDLIILPPKNINFMIDKVKTKAKNK